LEGDFKREETLRSGNLWWKCRFGLVKDEGQLVIRPSVNSLIEFYNPLKDGKRPGQQLMTPTEQDWAPHIHIARVKDEEGALEFANLWGLLGLWELNSYREAPLLFPQRGTVKEFLEKEHSLWFQWDIPGGILYPQYICHQEPVLLFLEAAERYRRWLDQLSREKEEESGNFHLHGLDCNPDLRWEPEGKRWEFSWSFDSLYKAIRLRAALDLAGGVYGFRRCKWAKCGRFFLAKNAKDRFCSYRCQNNYFAMESKKRREGLTNGRLNRKKR